MLSSELIGTPPPPHYVQNELPPLPRPRLAFEAPSTRRQPPQRQPPSDHNPTTPPATPPRSRCKRNSFQPSPTSSAPCAKRRIPNDRPEKLPDKLMSDRSINFSGKNVYELIIQQASKLGTFNETYARSIISNVVHRLNKAGIHFINSVDRHMIDNVKNSLRLILSTGDGTRPRNTQAAFDVILGSIVSPKTRSCQLIHAVASATGVRWHTIDKAITRHIMGKPLESLYFRKQRSDVIFFHAMSTVRIFCFSEGVSSVNTNAPGNIRVYLRDINWKKVRNDDGKYIFELLKERLWDLLYSERYEEFLKSEIYRQFQYAHKKSDGSSCTISKGYFRLLWPENMKEPVHNDCADELLTKWNEMFRQPGDSSSTNITRPTEPPVHTCVTATIASSATGS